MEKNWHRRHTSGGCSPLVRLGKVGSSLETQSTLILVKVLLTMVWEHLSPGSSLSSPRDLWEPPLSGAHYFPGRNARMGIYAFMPQAPQGSGWGDVTHFPSTKDLLPLFLIHRELSHQSGLHSKLFSDHPGIRQWPHRWPVKHLHFLPQDLVFNLTTPSLGPQTGLLSLKSKHPVSLTSFSTHLLHLTITIIRTIFRVDQRAQFIGI